MKPDTLQVAVCGGGNAAHTLVALLASHQEVSVSVFLSFDDEARRWQEGVAVRGGIEAVWSGYSLIGLPKHISSDPSQVIPGASLIFLALPAFAHEDVLRQIAPYLEPGAWLGAIPARSCFDLCVRDVLGDRAASLVIFGFQTLPWACRILRYGQAVTVLGNKTQVDLAVWPKEQSDVLANDLGKLLDISIHPIANFLSLSLAGTGQIIHPGIMYGLFHGWNGMPYAEAPLFYQGVDTFTAEVLESLSDEVQSLRKAIEQLFPTLDLSAVRPLAEWLNRCYQKDIHDNSNLQAAMNSNRSYAGLRAPVSVIEKGYAPDFNSRYLSEDVPYGLLASLGIAHLLPEPVATPRMVHVIEWAQQCMGREYLIDGELRGRDLVASRAPQRFGYTTISQLINDEHLMRRF